jgi:hypothetical protein
MVADRDTVGGPRQGSASLDANLFFSKTLGMTAQAIQSYGPFRSGAEAFFLRPSYDTPTGHFHVRYTHLGDRFADNANVVGFIRDDNRREFDSAIEKTLWVRGGAVERLGYDSNSNIYWGQNGPLRSWEVIQGLGIDFRNRLSGGVRHVEDLQRFEQDFRNRRTELSLGYNTRAYQSMRVGYAFGRNFDADLGLLTAQASYKVTPQMSVEYELQRLTLDPDPDSESTWIHVGRMNHFFHEGSLRSIVATCRRFSCGGVCRHSAPCSSRISAEPPRSARGPIRAMRSFSRQRPSSDRLPARRCSESGSQDELAVWLRGIRLRQRGL